MLQPPPSKRKLIEDKVDDTVEELKERHDDRYTPPQLRLWARMISAGHHESLDDPLRYQYLQESHPRGNRKSHWQKQLQGQLRH